MVPPRFINLDSLQAPLTKDGGCRFRVGSFKNCLVLTALSVVLLQSLFMRVISFLANAALSITGKPYW